MLYKSASQFVFYSSNTQNLKKRDCMHLTYSEFALLHWQNQSILFPTQVFLVQTSHQKQPTYLLAVLSADLCTSLTQHKLNLSQNRRQTFLFALGICKNQASLNLAPWNSLLTFLNIVTWIYLSMLGEEATLQHFFHLYN